MNTEKEIFERFEADEQHTLWEEDETGKRSPSTFFHVAIALGMVTDDQEMDYALHYADNPTEERPDYNQLMWDLGVAELLLTPMVAESLEEVQNRAHVLQRESELEAVATGTVQHHRLKAACEALLDRLEGASQEIQAKVRELMNWSTANLAHAAVRGSAKPNPATVTKARQELQTLLDDVANRLESIMPRN